MLGSGQPEVETRPRQLTRGSQRLGNPASDPVELSNRQGPRKEGVGCTGSQHPMARWEQSTPNGAGCPAQTTLGHPNLGRDGQTGPPAHVHLPLGASGDRKYTWVSRHAPGSGSECTCALLTPVIDADSGWLTCSGRPGSCRSMDHPLSRSSRKVVPILAALGLLILGLTCARSRSLSRVRFGRWEVWTLSG